MYLAFLNEPACSPDPEKVPTTMPRFVITQGSNQGKAFELTNGTTFIGRSLRNDISLADKSVSNRHLKVFRIGRKFFVEDLKSTNGTRINDERLESGEGFEVEEGDLIRLGRIVLRIEALPELSAIESSAGSWSHKADSPPPPGEAEADRRRLQDHGFHLIENVSRLLRQSFNLHGFCRKVLEYILESLPRIDTAALVYLDPFKPTRLENKTVVMQSRPDLGPVHANAVSERIIDRVLERSKTIRVLNAACEYSGDLPASTDKLRIQSVLCIPLISNSVIRGALYVHSTRSPCGFRTEDLSTLNTLSVSLAVAFEKTLLAARPRRPLPAPG